MKESRKSYKLNEINEFMSSGEGLSEDNDKKQKSIEEKQAKKLKFDTASFNINEGGNKETVGYKENKVVKEPTPEETARFKYFSSYGERVGGNKKTEEYTPSEEYKEHTRNKLKNHWRELGTRTEKLMNDVYEKSSSTDKKTKILGISLDPTKHSSGNATIEEQQMPEKNTISGNSKSELDPNLEIFIHKNTTYYRDQVAGNKIEDQFYFREKPYEFMRQAKINAINKKKGEIVSTTGTKAADVNKRSDLKKQITRLEEEVGTLDNIINKKVPVPTDKYFDKKEIEFDKKMLALHEDSIVTLNEKGGEVSYLILKVKKDKVFYKNLKTGEKKETKLEFVKNMLRDPKSRILDVRKKGDNKNKKETGQLSEKYKNSSEKKEEKEVEPTIETENEKLKEIDQKLKYILEKEAILLERKKVVEGQIKETKKELYATMVPKPENTDKLIGWAPEKKSKLQTKIEEMGDNQVPGSENNSHVFEMSYPTIAPQSEDASRLIGYSGGEERATNEDIKVNPVYVEGPVKEFEPVKLVDIKEDEVNSIENTNTKNDENNSETIKQEGNSSDIPHYVKEYKESALEKELNAEELRREVVSFFDQNPFGPGYEVRNVTLKFLDKEDSFEIHGKIDGKSMSIKMHGYSNELGEVITETKLKRFGIISTQKGETWEKVKFIAGEIAPRFKEYLADRYGKKINNINYANRKVVIQLEDKK